MKRIKIYYSAVSLLFLTQALPCYSIAAPTAGETSGKTDTITFIHITDPHVCNLTGYHPFFVEKRQHFGKNAGPLAHFFESVPKKYQSDFVVVTGDNIDYYEAQTADGKMLDTQIEQYTHLLDSCEVPAYLTLGNHDIASYFVSPDLVYTNNQFLAGRARAAWMRNASCFKDGTYYSRVFRIDTITFRLIFLDNGFYATKEISDGELPFIIDQSQLLWLDSQLKASSSDVEIIFMHMPLPFEKSVENRDLTVPTSKYSSKSRSYNLFSVLENNSSTRLIIVGHEHINNVNNYSFPNGNKLTQVMTGAFGYDPDNWRMIQLTNDKIIISYVGEYKTEYIIPLM